MARLSRYLLPNQPQHVILRGNNRQAVFFGDGDYLFYLDRLRDACVRYSCVVHAYVLMTNHVHLLASPATAEALSRTMQSAGMRYAQYINWRRERTGTLWQGRYYAVPIDSDAYFLVCSRYIELNPVRAGMVGHPQDYPWSSFGANATDRRDPLVTPHPLYLSLGRTDAECREAYRALFDSEIDPSTLAEIRDATQKGWPLGSSPFRTHIEEVSRRRAGPLPRGGSRTGAGRRAKSIASDPID